MTVARGLVVGTVLVVSLTAVLSGPLVGPVDLTGAGSSQDSAALDGGSATVTNASLPAQARFVAGEFGSGSTYLAVPPATVELASVTGIVRISYKLSVDELGMTRATTHFVDDASEAREVTLTRRAVDPGRITEDRYDGTLVVEVFDDDGARTVAERAVSVEVDR